MKKTFSTGWNILKSVVPFLIGIVVLVFIIALLAGFFTEKIPPSETKVVEASLSEEELQETAEVHEVTKEYFSESVGTLKAASRTEISSRIMAPIEEIRVNAGDVVEEGEVLILLDRRDAEARLNQAQAALSEARASLAQAKRNFERDKQLFEQAVVAEKRFEQSQTALNVAEASTQKAEQAVEEANVNLTYTTIKASQSGTIVDRYAEPGDIARPGVPLLTLYDPASLRLEAPVVEKLAVQLKKGDTVSVHIEALQRDMKAVVDEIVPQAEAASRSFLVKVALPRSQELYEGMFGRLRLSAGKRRHLCLPTDAIQTIGQLEFVEVVDPQDLTLERRFITTGRLGMPGRIEVLSGLEPGERVVLQKNVPQ